LPKIVGECGIPIKDNGGRHAMDLKNLVKKNLGNHGRGKGALKSTKVSILLHDFGRPTMKSMEMFLHIVAIIGNGCNVLESSQLHL